MRILEQGFRVYVDGDGLEAAIAFYERLQQTRCARRVRIAETGVTAAKVGGVLILAGSQESLAGAREVNGIFYLDDLKAFEAWLLDNGAEVLHGPRVVTGGRNLTARHPDGLVVEYFEARS